MSYRLKILLIFSIGFELRIRNKRVDWITFADCTFDQSMAGLYIHIPFCKQACHYCNFHFSTSLHYKKDLVEAINLEIELQRDYLNGEKLETIYFGGGTPSLLSPSELDSIFKAINTNFKVAPNAEITLEANPDDLKSDQLKALQDSPINRLSIGIQSFRNADLEYMNRSHNAQEAWKSLERARSAGFEKLSLDLIYGVPGLDNKAWEENIRIALDLGPAHISAYCLTVEPKTPLEKRIQKGLSKPVNELEAAEHFEILMDKLESAGFLHYEISNFALPGHLAIHNTNYWKGVHYLGVGPSAHSYDTISRQWNVANNQKYIQSISDGNIPSEKEILSADSIYHEYVMTRLRTSWGIDIEEIKDMGTAYEENFMRQIESFLQSGQIEQKGGHFTLTRNGKLYADQIAMGLFMDA
ncbi:MAG: radical SAM family heme chaperone HemW [Saprospiraceae bacterium]